MVKDVSKGCLRALAITLGALFLSVAGFMAIDYFWGDKIPFLKNFRDSRKEELKSYLRNAEPPGYDSATVSAIVERYSDAATTGDLSSDHYWKVMNAVMEAGSDDVISPVEASIALELMREVTDTLTDPGYVVDSLPPVKSDEATDSPESNSGVDTL